MSTFTLSKLQGSKNSFTGRLTFAQTKEFKIGMVTYFIFYMGAMLADDFGQDWFVIPGFILAFIAFIMAYFPLSYSRNSGEVILTKDEIELHSKKEDHSFPESSIRLTNISELEINIVQSIRWWSSYVIMQFIVKQDETESSFGLTIKNRSQEKQYLEALESWYRAEYPVKEYDIQGSRIFKLYQGKSYANIQQIKTEYGINW
ncbi:MAG: hypothetical protein WD059_14835 [Balneolaceae bacterium]